jgi:hypothetical protein
MDRNPYLLFFMEAGSESADKDVNLNPLLYLAKRQPLGILGYVENGGGHCGECSRKKCCQEDQRRNRTGQVIFILISCPCVCIKLNKGGIAFQIDEFTWILLFSSLD